MLIGIMSDTHGRREAARKAMELFQRLGTAHVVHCGDVGGIEVFGDLLALPCTFVWGNTDEPDHSTYAYLEAVGLHAPSTVPVRLTLDGKTFAVFHGHEPAFERAITAATNAAASITNEVTASMKDTSSPASTSLGAGGTNYILHGHTHLRRDERAGFARIINPGALHRARPKTVATLDTQTDALAFHEIEA